MSVPVMMNPLSLQSLQQRIVVVSEPADFPRDMSIQKSFSLGKLPVVCSGVLQLKPRMLRSLAGPATSC